MLAAFTENTNNTVYAIGLVDIVVNVVVATTYNRRHIGGYLEKNKKNNKNNIAAIVFLQVTGVLFVFNALIKLENDKLLIIVRHKNLYVYAIFLHVCRFSHKQFKHM